MDISEVTRLSCTSAGRPKQTGAGNSLIVLRFAGKQGRGRDWLLFANPADTKRDNLAVRISRDGGQSWSVARTLYEGAAAYSSLAVLPDGNIGCLYERGERGPYEKLTFARFDLTWLTSTTAP